MVSIFIALGVGLVAGVLVGMLGVGGGLVLVPGMVLLLGFDQHVAQGMSLLAIMVTALVGAVVQNRQGNVETRLVFRLVPVTIPFALAGAWLAGLMEPRLLTYFFALLLLVIGVRLVLPGSEEKGVGAG